MFGNPCRGPLHPFGWSRPAGNTDFVITKTFAQHDIGAKGVDIDNGGPQGDPLLAMEAGVISAIFTDAAGAKVIRVRHGGALAAYETAHAHCLGFPAGMAVGMPVARGQVIAYLGATGNVTGPHSHVGCKKNGVEVDWVPLLDSAGGDTVTTVLPAKLFTDGPHTLNIPAGGRVDGWTATGAAPAKSQTWPNGSSFPADCLVTIDQEPNRAPQGTFWHCTAGYYAGLYIPIGQATDAGPVNPPANNAAAEKKGAQGAAKAAVDYAASLP